MRANRVFFGICVVGLGILFGSDLLADGGAADGPESTMSSTTTGSRPMPSGDHGLLERLRSGKSADVQGALTEVFRSGRAANPVLLQALEIPNPDVQVAAIRMLREFKVREAAPLFAKLVDAQDAYLQHVAILGLGHLGAQEYLPLLLDKLNRAKDSGTQCAVITALGLLGDGRAVPTLERVLEGESEIVRIYAAGALGLLGNKKGLELALRQAESAEMSYQRAALQALGQLGDERGRGLLQAISADRKAKNREVATIALRRIQLKGLSPQEKRTLLREDLSEENLVGEWAAGELAEVGGPESVELLKAGVKDRRGVPRRWVVMQLLKLGVPFEEAVR